MQFYFSHFLKFNQIQSCFSTSIYYIGHLEVRSVGRHSRESIPRYISMIRHTWNVSLTDEKVKCKKGDENQQEGDQAKKQVQTLNRKSIIKI